ncbi:MULTISPECIES: cupin domain-containing protein [Anaeromyxobacter]|uniref:cupin domain-containing protein n=1 Tax=Anaeromyxobacter TaxID=161492 RepID=UPI001F59F302|nr:MULTISPECIES: cupin domain-containing protein [unclassified Anaeromyxobacter]
MARISIKRFSSPDETRPFKGNGHAEILKFGDGVVGRGVFEPGWRWSTHVKPLAGTRSCQAAHSGYVVSGRMHLVMDDGEEAEIGAGDYAVIPPGHDAWTVGDEACVIIDFAGMEHYAEGRTTRAQPGAESQAPAHH